MSRPPDTAECPAGWVVEPPDFVGVGFQRCGTTRWWRLLTAHPQVHRLERKELHFFDRLQCCEPSDEIARDYSRLFARPSGLLTGEWTPRYVLDHWTPPLLRAAAPEALFLVSLRDPVERFVSGLTWSERRGVRSDDNVAAALVRSMYAPQLRYLSRHAGQGRLLVLQFEKCLADPGGELRRTYAALGVDPDFEPPNAAARVNESELRGAITTRERLELVSWLEQSVVELATEFPEIEVALWPNFAHLAA